MDFSACSEQVSKTLLELFEKSEMTWDDVFNAIQTDPAATPSTSTSTSNIQIDEVKEDSSRNYQMSKIGAKKVLESEESLLETDDDEKKPRMQPAELLKALAETLNDDFGLIKLMMDQNMLKKKQHCKKCMKKMNLRKRKNNYEWRCRSKSRGDCSSCSIKNESWFGYSKLSFRTMISFLMMHCEKCPSVQIMKGLNITAHTVIEFKKMIYELSTRIADKYPPIGGDGVKVQIEKFAITTKKSCSINNKGGGSKPTFEVLAGEEVGSTRCFAEIIDEANNRTVENILARRVKGGSDVVKRFDCTELDMIDGWHPSNLDKQPTVFTELKAPVTDSSARTPQLLQDYLNDVVVRRMEAKNYLKACISEVQCYF